MRSVIEEVQQQAPAEFQRLELLRRRRAYEILALVRACPGIPAGEAAKRLELGSGSFYYHLHKLQDARLVHAVVAGRRRLLYPDAPNADTEPEWLWLSVLRGRTTRRVASAVQARPGVTVGQLCVALADSRRAIHYQVDRLAEVGLVLKHGRWRIRLHAAARLEEMLARVDD